MGYGQALFEFFHVFAIGAPFRRRDQEVADAPDGQRPLDVLLCAFRKARRILEDNRSFSERRLKITAMTPTLRECDLAKAASLTEPRIDDPSQSLDAHLTPAFDDLHALSAPAQAQAQPAST
ncbi:hypothetical protein ABH926_005377 [Catenulispora sp. GP43]|uniref:hypothetical protein n=1 Tax=Catenulispora sp. GP43 TaxID=3156263 RepID=UPI0035151C3E